MTATSLYLSRARLRAGRGEALASLAPVLLSAHSGRSAALGHRIVWMLFQTTPDAGRAPDWREKEQGDGFLWRDDGNGRYLVLSRKPPSDPHGLFDLDPPKEFMPALASGDRLSFALRANPTVSTKRPVAWSERDRKRAASGDRLRGKKVDVVMHALHGVEPTAWKNGRAVVGRALERDRIASSAVAQWLADQGRRHGFELDGVPTVSGYSQVEIERAHGRPAGIGVADVAGELRVTDPGPFLARLPIGFGSAKAFGCGLMLIRRAI